MHINYQSDAITFESDKLKRESYADSIISIIQNRNMDLSDNQSFVMALDSQWGSGKSVFCKMLKNKIDNEAPNIKTIIYNAWENDYCDNAFNALFYTIVDKKIKGIFDKQINKKNGEVLLNSAVDIMKAANKDMIKAIPFISPENILNSLVESPKSYRSFLMSGPLKDIHDLKVAFTDFKKLFISASSHLTKNDNKLFIIVDELDRCRPTFAVETLEIIKHLFDIPNVVFLLSVDFSQLKHSIATVYGQGMDSVGYLHRFVNYVLKLPEPSKNNYISYLEEEYPFLKYGSGSNYSSLINGVNAILSFHSLSFRDINIIYENFRMFFISKYADNTSYKTALPYMFLLMLKYKRPVDFSYIVSGRPMEALYAKSVEGVYQNVREEFESINSLENPSVIACILDNNIVSNNFSTTFHEDEQKNLYYGNKKFDRYDIVGGASHALQYLTFDDIWRLQLLGEKSLTAAQYFATQVEMFNFSSNQADENAYTIYGGMPTKNM